MTFRPGPGLLRWCPLGLVFFNSCSGEPESTGSESVGRAVQAAVYGADDRHEAIVEPDPILRERALRSTVALVRGIDRWSFCDPSSSHWTAMTLGERESLCEGEPFRDQPVLASCSGTLIDRDLIMTAQHCVGSDEKCRETRFIMGLYVGAGGQVRTIPRRDVFSCRERVAVPNDRDVVIIKLDRPVGEPYEPAPIARAPFETGAPLFASGFPTGIPMKAAGSCEILGYRDVDDGYLLNCDLFGGNSGSGFFNPKGELLGVYYQGSGDYKPSPDEDCFIRFTLGEDGVIDGIPTPQLGLFSPASPIVDRLCESEFASQLCHIPPVCGDGRCQGETPEDCASDCPPPNCGDGVCDLEEDYDCAVDCGLRDRRVECGPTSQSGGGGGGGGGDGGEGVDEPGSGGDSMAPEVSVSGGGCGGSGGEGHAASFAGLGFLLARLRRAHRERSSLQR